MKTLPIKKYEFERNMQQIINSSGLPAFVIEAVLKDMIVVVKAAADEQLKNDLEAYKAELTSGGAAENVHEQEKV